MDLTVVVITSPFVSMPSTAIISCVVASFALIEGLAEAKVMIVMDGCKISSENRTKKGRITAELRDLYDVYHEALLAQFTGPRFTVLRCEQHLGFALAVKFGLERCPTTYALIAQHDRTFCHPFARLQDLLDAMDRHPHIRYIGFPTNNNVTHDRMLNARYRLNVLNQRGVKLDLGEQLYLQPLVFWFDSQHLCHVQRYLCIFRPFRSLPPNLRDIVGLGAVKDMLLKPGDFIEDKFGQVQRNVLTGARADGRSDEVVLDLFRWFGSYLCWENDGQLPFAVELEAGRARTAVMVTHLDARHLDMGKMAEHAAAFGADAIKSKLYLQICLQQQQQQQEQAVYMS